MAGGHGGASRDRWLVTYADMLTLLLALFIIMYSISKADVQRFRQFQQGLQRAFHIDVLQGQDANTLADAGAIIDQPQPTTSGVEATPEPALTAPSPDAEVAAQLRARLAGLVPAGARGNIAVDVRPDGLVVSLYGVLLFDAGRTDLRPDGRRVLDGVAQAIRPLPYDVRVEGHTDNVQPDPGPYPSNWDLSVSRALVVTRYLIDVAGFDPSRLSAAGYAEYRPVASNATREGRLRNRRVDLVLVHPHPPSGGSP